MTNEEANDFLYKKALPVVVFILCILLIGWLAFSPTQRDYIGRKVIVDSDTLVIVTVKNNDFILSNNVTIDQEYALKNLLQTRNEESHVSP